MKIRQGFVSNSSSSSFVILLPENFDVNKHVEENWEKFDSYAIGKVAEEYDGDDDSQSYEKQRVKDIINDFINDECVYEDDYTEFRIVSDVLRDYVIGGFDVSSDSGSGTLADREQIKKILNS